MKGSPQGRVQVKLERRESSRRFSEKIRDLGL
jgi:hypothetical protein